LLDIFSTADGTHAAHFWQCLSEAYTTGRITMIPVYDRPKIDLEAFRPHLEAAASGHNSMPRPLLFSETPSQAQAQEVSSTSGASDMRILLSDKQLLDLKTFVSLSANANQEEERLSTQDCLSAALAISLSRAREEVKCPLGPINAMTSMMNVSTSDSSMISTSLTHLHNQIKLRFLKLGFDPLTALNAVTRLRTSFPESRNVVDYAKSIRKSIIDMKTNPGAWQTSLAVASLLLRDLADKGAFMDTSALLGDGIMALNAMTK
jgi:hypothetical protein